MAGRELPWLGGVELRTVKQVWNSCCREKELQSACRNSKISGQEWQPSGGIRESVKKSVRSSAEKMTQGPTLENGKERVEERPACSRDEQATSGR